MAIWRNVYQSALIPQNFPCPEKFLIARLKVTERTRITHHLAKVYFSKRGSETSYVIFHRISTSSFPKRFLKIYKNDYMVSFPDILTQGKLFILLRRSCLWKINIFCYLGRRLYYKKEHLRKAAKTYEDVLYKWIPFSFALRYNSHNQIPHNVATRHAYKWITSKHSSYKRLM